MGMEFLWGTMGNFQNQQLHNLVNILKIEFLKQDPLRCRSVCSRSLSLSLSLSACPVSTATVASLVPALTPELTPRPSDSPRCPLCAPRGTQGAPFKMQVTLCPSPARALPIAPRIEFNPPVAHGDLCDLPPALPDLIPSHAPSSPWPSVCSSSPQACPLFGAFPGCAPLTRGSAPTSPPQRGPLPGQPAGLALSRPFLALTARCACAPRASMSRAPPRPPTQPLEKCGAALGTSWGLSGVRQRHKRGIAPCHVRAPRCPEPPFEDL